MASSRSRSAAVRSPTVSSCPSGRESERAARQTREAPSVRLPSLVKEIGIAGSLFTFVVGVAALVLVWTKVPKRGAVPSRCSKTASRPARSASGRAESAVANTNELCGLRLWGGGRPAGRIPFRANSFTRTPDAFVETVAPPQTPSLQAARARNSGSPRRGGDRTAGRQATSACCFDLLIGVRMYVFRPVYVDMRATSQL